MRQLDSTQRSIRVSVKLPESMKENIDRLAQKDGTNASELIRNLLVQWLDKKQDDVPEEYTDLERAYFEDKGSDYAQQKLIDAGYTDDDLYKLVKRRYGKKDQKI